MPPKRGRLHRKRNALMVAVRKLRNVISLGKILSLDLTRKMLILVQIFRLMCLAMKPSVSFTSLTIVSPLSTGKLFMEQRDPETIVHLQIFL